LGKEGRRPLLAKDRESPPCLAYKTGREHFCSSGSSVTWVTDKTTSSRTIFGMRLPWPLTDSQGRCWETSGGLPGAPDGEIQMGRVPTMLRSGFVLALSVS
jgi:hypothetical protein